MNGSGLTSRIFSAALFLLLAAMAINWAISLLSEVWTGIVIVGVVIMLVVGGISWWRRSNSGW